MALNSLYKIVFKNSSQTGYVAGDIVITYWDDVAEGVVSYKNGVLQPSGATLGISQYRPHRGSLVINYTVTNEPVDEPIYQFCDSTTLVQFVFQTAFPYTKTQGTPNSASCVANVVCDLLYIGAPIIVRPTTDVSSDGEITVVAEGSNGSVRYSLNDDFFSVMTNTTGVFTGLGKGAYIIYARDQFNCSRSISVLLETNVNYDVRYRLEYNDIEGQGSKIDILERDYSGDIEEVCGTDTPLMLSLRGENSDIFTPILSSGAVIGLTSETNFQFIDLFTQDDRKYQVRFYKNTGSGDVERWRGYLTPSLYQEQYYTDRNYYVEAEATDQLANLRNILFQDASGNNVTGDLQLIKILSIILSYTDLSLNIRSCISIFDLDMDVTVSDDPLVQTYIDAETYLNSSGDPFTCYDVLNNILLSFGSRIFQWQGYWYLIPIDFFTNTITYREFDTNGDYISNGSFDPLIDIKQPTESNRACWANKTQNLEVRPALGKCTINYQLRKVPFGLINGGFESLQLREPVSGPFLTTQAIGIYDNWSLNLNGNVASLATVSTAAFGNNSQYSGSINSNGNNTNYAEDAYLQSVPNNIIFSESDWIIFKFDFFPDSRRPPLYLKFKFSLKLEDYYLQGDGTWTTDSDFEWVEVNVQEGDFNSWKTLEIKTTCPPVAAEVVTTFTAKLMHGALDVPTWQFTSSANLQALPTVDLPTGYITWVIQPGVVGRIERWYKLEASTDATSGFVSLRPSDYNGSTNKVVWKLINNVSQELNDGYGSYGFVRKFDNVNVELLPQGITSPEETVIERVNNARIKESREFEIVNGDVSGDITNSKFTYFNYYKYSDGTPTSYWNRFGVDESMDILELLAHRVIEQHNIPKFKLTGDLKTDTFFGFFNSFYEDSSEKYFIQMSMSLNDKQCISGVELQQVNRLLAYGAEGIGEFSELEFSNSFDI